MSPRARAGTDPQACRTDIELTRLRDEMRALMELIPGALMPGLAAPRARPDSLSDEDLVEAGFDNLPV